MKRAGFVLALLLLRHSAAGQVAPPQQPPPESGAGSYGITRTVAELISAENSAPSPKRLRPKRLKPALSKVATGGSSSGPRTASKPSVSIGPRTPQVSGILFNGGSGLAAAGPGAVTPPDSMGAVGLDQFLVCINNRITVFSKTGVIGGLNIDVDSFFATVLGGDLSTDPRVRFDRNTQRWFVTAISDALTNNRIMIAVSSGPTIADKTSFTFFFFQQNLAAPAGDINLFADYPTLGIDINALYMGASMFDSGSNFRGTSAWVIQKSSILGAGPIQVKAFRGLNVGGTGMSTAQGVDNDDPAATEGYFIGVDGNVFSKLVMRRISNPGSINPTISGDLNLAVPTTSFPIGLATAVPGVPALQSNAQDDGDDRLYMAQIKKFGGTSSLWTCHNIGVTSTGVASSSPTRDAIRWYKIGTLTGAPSLTDSGTFFDNAVGQGQSYWMPSLNVSGQGHMVVAFNFARFNQFIGAMMSGHLSTDGLGVSQPGTLLDTSVFGYHPSTVTPDGTTFERWGDYSYTSLDPTDDMTMWTVQEFALDSTHWGVRVIQIKAPQPASPASSSPGTVAAGQGSVTVTITGTPPVQSEAWFEPGPTFPNHLTGLLHNTVTSENIPINNITVIDGTHLTLDLNTIGITPASGTFDLTITNPDGQFRVGGGILNVSAAPGNPSCVITGPASPSNVSPTMNFTVTFPEIMNGIPPLMASNFVITNATLPVLSGAGPIYNLAVTPTAQGAVTCRLPVNSATGSVSGLKNTASNTASVVWDTIPPTVTLTPLLSPTKGNPVFNLVFSESVTGLAPGDFTLSSGGVSSVTGSGANYTVTVLAPAQGLLTITLPAGSAQDAAGNGNTVGGSSATYDTVAPTVVVTPPAAATLASPIPFTVTFSEPVSGLAITGITVSNGVGSLTGAGANYTVNVVPGGQGAVTVQVLAGQATDAAGNLNLISNVGSTIYDTVPPTTTILTMPFNPSGSSSATFTFSSSEGGSTFLVQIDGGAFAANVTGTQTYNGLTLGLHTFNVAAVDPAGNVDPTVATYSWLIPIIIIDGMAPLLNPFDSSAFLANWTISAPNGGVGWTVDATPATILVSNSFVSAPASLNYNNGTDYSTGASANAGSARSPQIDRTLLAGTARLKFMCNYQTDSIATATDTRIVTIWKGDLSGTWMAPIQLSGGVSALGACSAMGTWHQHVLDLAGVTPDFRVEFAFDTVNNVNNTGAGWFIDDFEVSDLVVSSLHQYVSGTPTVIPVGGATTSGVIDIRGTVDAGPAGSVRLEVEIQPVAVAFTGTPTLTATASGAGAPVSVTYTVPALGDYHWRARTVDVAGAVTSSWMEFGLNAVAAPDFSVVPAAVGGGGGGGGCGATGFEGFLIAALLRLRRRRRA
jgi:hypothetical protein